MIRWKNKTRMLLAVVLMFSLTVCLLPATAAAADSVDVGATGTITLQFSETTDYMDEFTKAEKKLTVDIYKVAEIDEFGGYETLSVFADRVEGLADLVDNINFNTNTADLVDMIMEKLYEESADDAVPAPGAKPEKKPFTTPQTVELAPGEAISLPVGLYLFVIHDVTVARYDYSFLPLLLSVPSLGTDAQAEQGRNPGDPAPEEHLTWQYDFNVFLKPTREVSKGRMVIEKYLDSYNPSLGPVTFVFEVTVSVPAENPGDPPFVYTMPYSLTFDGTQSTKRVLIEDLPVGATVTVVEKYSGESYGGGVVDGNGVVVIIPVDEEDVNFPGTVNGIPAVFFANSYDGGLIPNIGIVNEYTVTDDGKGFNSPEQREDSSSSQGGVV